MGQNAGLIIGIAGAVTGGLGWLGFAGVAGGLSGAATGYAIGSAVGGLAFPQKKPNDYRVQNQISSLKIIGTDYGQCIGYIRGSAMVAGQAWWHPDEVRAISTWAVSDNGGGKGGGGGGQTFTQTITYETDILFGLADNICIGATRILQEGTLIYTADADATTASVAASYNTGHWDRATFYDGNPAQLPDPTYEAAVGTANAQAYRGRSTFFIQGWKLGTAGTIRQLMFEVVADGTSTAVTLGTMMEGTSASDTYLLTTGGTNPKSLAGQPLNGKIWVAHEKGGSGYELEYVDVRSGLTLFSIGTDAIIASFVRISAIDFDNSALIISGTKIYRVKGDTGELLWVETNLTPIDLTVDLNRDLWCNSTAFGVSVIYVTEWGIPTTTLRHCTMGFTVMSFWCRNAANIPGRMYLVQTVGPTIGYINTTTFTYVDIGVTVEAANYTAPLIGADLNIYVRRFTGVNSAVRKYDLDGNLSGSLVVPCTGNVQIHLLDSSNMLWVRGDNAADDWKVIDTATMTLSRTVTVNGFLTAIAELDTGFPAFFGTAASAGAFGKLGITESIERITKVAPSYDDVVSDICLRCGLTAAQFDVTDLASIVNDVPSLLWDQISSGRSMLEMLATTGYFDKVESDKIYWRRRGQATVDAIPADDLGAHTGDDQPEPLALRIANDLEIPAKISLTCPNIDNDYQPMTLTSDRLVTATSETVEQITISLGLTPARGQGVVETIALDRVARSVGGEIAVLADYSHLECGDRFTGTAPDGTVYTLGIVEHTDEFPLMRCRVAVDDATALISEGTTTEDYESSTVVSAPSDTLLRILDIPLLRDADDGPGPIVATKGNSTPYPGSAIFSSLDDVTYDFETTVDESAIFGVCTTALGDYSGSAVVDWSTTVTVNVGSATLTTSTYDAILDDLSINLILIGNEIIQFIVATFVSTGVYTLSGLQRGLFGTERVMTGHIVGDRAVLLREAGLRNINMSAANIGNVVYIKGVTKGRLVSSADGQEFTNTAVSLMPLSPVAAKITRDASLNATITFERRSRYEVLISDTLGIVVPLAEDEENWDVVIYSSSAYTTVMRIINTFTNVDDGTIVSVAYSAADQTTDFGSTQATLYVKAYQISGIVGRGYPLAMAA